MQHVSYIHKKLNAVNVIYMTVFVIIYSQFISYCIYLLQQHGEAHVVILLFDNPQTENKLLTQK